MSWLSRKKTIFFIVLLVILAANVAWMILLLFYVFFIDFLSDHIFQLIFLISLNLMSFLFLSNSDDFLQILSFIDFSYDHI